MLELQSQPKHICLLLCLQALTVHVSMYTKDLVRKQACVCVPYERNVNYLACCFLSATCRAVAPYLLLKYMHIACHRACSLSDGTWCCCTSIHPKCRCIRMMLLKASLCGGRGSVKSQPPREALLHTNEMRRHDQHLLHTPIHVTQMLCWQKNCAYYGHQIWRTN